MYVFVDVKRYAEKYKAYWRSRSHSWNWFPLLYVRFQGCVPASATENSGRNSWTNRHGTAYHRRGPRARPDETDRYVGAADAYAIRSCPPVDIGAPTLAVAVELPDCGAR